MGDGRKGLDDNQKLDSEIVYQEKMLSLGNFLIEISKTAKRQDNINRCNKAAKELTEIALYINSLEHDNLDMKLQLGFKKGKTYNEITKLLKQCLKQ